MKIRNRITLIFTLLTGSLLIVAFLFIYYFSIRYTNNEFYERLRERTNIVAQSRLEKDELSSRIYEEIRKQHFQILPDEQEAVIKVDVSGRRIIDKNSPPGFPEHFLNDIFERHHAELKIGEVYHAGILYGDNEGEFIVVASAKDLYGASKIKNLASILIIALLSGLTAIFFIGRFYAGKVLKPIARIIGRANEISATNLHLRLEHEDNRDELFELSLTFNKMLDRLEASFEVQTGFVNNASHELRNPLTGILAATEVVLQRERSAEEYKDSLLVIEKEAQRLDLLLSSLLKLAHTHDNDKGLFVDTLRVDELLLSLKRNIDTLNPGENVAFDFTGLPPESESLIVMGNQGLLTIAFTNIIDNACKFSMGKGVIVSLSSADRSILVSVKDYGLGIPGNELERITEPFFRASNARGFKGFGIGLALAQRIITLHGGAMKMFSQESSGTEVHICLPVSNPAL